MIRVLFFVLLVFALGLGFAWLAERPGEMVVTFGGYQYEVSLMVAAAALTAIVAAVMISWWLVKSVWNSPRTVARYFRVRRRDRGYQALSTGMIAAGAGDAALARKKKKEAMKLISGDQEPLIHLLDAQASLLEGDHDAARRKFESMLEDPEMRILGLRGLYLEAERLGERAAAQHYAERAAEIAPQLGWAADAAIEARCAEGDWDAALRLVEAQKTTKQIDRVEAERKRAVLLTAKATTLLDTDPQGARNAGTEAHRLAPDLVPAAVVAARAAYRQNDLKKGSKILEAAWRKEAHPEIAETYIHARHGDSVQDRLHRAKKLQSQKQNNAESALALARAALEAGDFKLAREQGEAAIRIGPREGAFLLMADVEEAETGDHGRIRQWLARAVRAPLDPAWVADGVTSESWAPVSPVTGKLDAFAWRPPAERPLLMIEEQEEDEMTRPTLIAPANARPVADDADAAREDDPVEVIVVAPPPEPSGGDVRPAPPRSDKEAAPEMTGKTTAAPSTPETDRNVAAQVPPVEKTESASKPAQPTVTAANDEAGRPAPEETGKPPIPDDPGVEPIDDEEERSRRFRLF